MLLFYLPGACSLAEMIALEWLEKPYKLCRVAGADRQLPAYLALNPHGAVPMLRTGDRVLTENAAILLHLADRYPKAKLAPTVGTPERDDLHFWLSYLDSGFHGAFVPIFKPQRLLEDESQHAALVEQAQGRVRTELEFLDQRLAGRDHVLESGRSVLDGYIVAMARWGQRFFDFDELFPELARFLRVQHSDPGVQRARSIEAGELTDPVGAFEGHVPFDQATNPANSF